MDLQYCVAKRLVPNDLQYELEDQVLLELVLLIKNGSLIFYLCSEFGGLAVWGRLYSVIQMYTSFQYFFRLNILQFD